MDKIIIMHPIHHIAAIELAMAEARAAGLEVVFASPNHPKEQVVESIFEHKPIEAMILSIEANLAKPIFIRNRTAAERAKPNQPWYARFQKNPRRR